jgi:predicted membrane channel-forming protein YqfA (hemolysin III family)
MVSAEAMVEASATMLVGIMFLVSLRQALGLKPTRMFFSKLVYPVILFATSGICATMEGLSPYDWVPYRFLFALGMISVVGVVFYLQNELEDREKYPGGPVGVRKLR